MSMLNRNSSLYQEDLDFILKTKGLSSLSGKSVLITGATGLIGKLLVDALMRLGGVSVIAVGRSTAKAQERFAEHWDNPLFRFVEADVTKPYDSALHADYVIPAASSTHPLAYSKYPIETIQTNALGAMQALEFAAKEGAIVLYPSSVEVYGNAYGDDVFTEGYTGALDLSSPRSCYNESKRLAESLCQSYCSEKGVDARIVRLSRVFGPTMLESDSKASSQFIMAAVRGEDIVLKSLGNQYYSYTYGADAASAMLYVMLNGASGEAYNISSAKCNVHLMDFAEICAAKAGKKVVYDVPSEAEAKGYSKALRAILDNTKLLSLGFQPKYEMRDAVERTIDMLLGR